MQVNERLSERPKCGVKDCDKLAIMLIQTQMMCGKHIILWDKMQKEKKQKEFENEFTDYLKKLEEPKL